MNRRPVVIGLIAVILAALAVVVFVTIDNRSDKQAGRPGTSTGGPSGTAPPVTSGIKPVIRGLIDRQGEPSKKALAYVHAYVVKVNWADLQPTADGPIASNNAIDKAVARVRQPDFKKVGMALKLRVFAGIGAPDWVKKLGGQPVTYHDNQPGASVSGGTIGRFWDKAYQDAYAQLQAKLAAKYDSVPEIREVTVSSCSTIFDEPFVRQPGDTANVANLRNAGYTVPADKECISKAIDAHNVWRHTTTDLDLSPFANVSDPGGNRDVAYTLQVADVCRRVLGYRCGLQNNALSTSKLANTQFKQMYARMAQLGSPLIFQTAARKRIGNETQVLEAAQKYGANSVELPQGYGSWSQSLLQSAAEGLSRNKVR